MISMKEARQLALDYVSKDSAFLGKECVIKDSATRENPIAHVFFYNTARSLEDDSVTHCLAGNGPLFVTKKDGKFHAAGTPGSVECFLENLEKYGALYPPNIADNPPR